MNIHTSAYNRRKLGRLALRRRVGLATFGFWQCCAFFGGLRLECMPTDSFLSSFFWNSKVTSTRSADANAGLEWDMGRLFLKKRHQGRHCDLRRTLRLLRRLEIADEFFPIEIIIKKLDEAWDTYRAVRKDGKKFRQDFTDGLAEAQAEAQNIPKKTALRNIQHREAQRSSGRTIKYVLMKLNGGGTSMVVIIRNGEMVEITTKEELEQALLHENEWKYHQTEGFSQLLSGPLLDDIGLLGEGPHVENILNGSYVVPDGTNPGTKLYLAAMAVPTGLNRARKEYTLEDFKLGWKKMK